MNTGTVVWAIVSIIVGLIGSAYAPQVKAAIQFGPRKLFQRAAAVEKDYATAALYAQGNAYNLLLFVFTEIASVLMRSVWIGFIFVLPRAFSQTYHWGIDIAPGYGIVGVGYIWTTACQGSLGETEVYPFRRNQ